MGQSSTVTLSIRHVPAEAHETLVARAEAKGQSLQEYLLTLVQEHASHPTRAEVLARIRGRREHSKSELTSEEIVAAIHAGREERTGQIVEAVHPKKRRR